MLWKKKALYLGPLLFLIFGVFRPFGTDAASAWVAGTALWMLTWWISEVVHMAVTSLLPILVFPWIGVLSVEEACAPYGDRMVFLFLGGFLIALSMEKWNLHRRLALMIIRSTGSGANRIIFGFMLASFLISMWISNTATALMMFPIASSVVELLMSDGGGDEKSRRNFSVCVMLSIAYGSSIGGIATIIGSPPNGAMKAFLESQYQITVSFFDWMAIGFPFALVLMILGYLVMTRVIFPNRLGKFQLGSEVIENELELLGPWSLPEKLTFGVFVSAAVLWMSQDALNALLPALKLNDVGIALICGVALFLLPASRQNAGQVLEWKDTRNLHWGVLLMFGGGLSLAKAFKSSGWVDTITTQLGFFRDLDVHHYVIILCLVGLVLTALMSNLAMVNLFVPVVAALAVATGQPPAMFAIPVTIAASCDFMFPMSTPPNAIAYSSGWVHARQMFRAGVVLNLISWLLLSAMVYMLI